MHAVSDRVAGYRPVVLMHGLFASSETMDIMKKMITAAHPGTPVHNIDAYNDGVRPVLLNLTRF